MNCPKCGYVQEERIDCRKCGVVFSKYYALHPESQKSSSEPAGEGRDPTESIRSVSDERESIEIAELRQQQKELNRLSNEFEFERAERTRVRSEIKLLDQRLQDVVKEVSNRLEPLAASLGLLSGAGQPDLGENAVQSIPNRLDRLEKQLALVASTPKDSGGGSTAQSVHLFEMRLLKMEETLDSIPRHSTSDSSGSLKVEFGNLFKEMEDLRISLQNVTVRYSEIGEIKKNFLQLTNRIDSLMPDIDSAREGGGRQTTKKIASLEQEVAALRAELRHAQEQMEAASRVPSRDPYQIEAVESSVHELATRVLEQDNRLMHLFSEMDDRLRTNLSEVRRLTRILEAVGSALQPTARQLEEPQA